MDDNIVMNHILMKKHDRKRLYKDALLWLRIGLDSCSTLFSKPFSSAFFCGLFTIWYGKPTMDQKIRRLLHLEKKVLLLQGVLQFYFKAIIEEKCRVTTKEDIDINIEIISVIRLSGPEAPDRRIILLAISSS